jgi:Bacterial membrane protein YfhO
MALALYLLTALLLLALAHRYALPLSRGAALVLVLLPLAITGKAMFTNGVIAPVDLIYEHPPMNWMKDDYGIVRASTGTHTDVYLEFIPWRKAAQWSMERGEWGLRNPFTYAGELLLGGEQEAMMWPITWIALLLDPVVSFNFTAAITMFIAALTAFLFARELGCREWTALVAAVGWSFAAGVVMYVLTAMGQVWAWTPLVFHGVRRVVERNEIGILTLGLTAIHACGHPESALYGTLFGAAYGVFELAQRRPWNAALKPLAYAVLAGVLALLLSAIHYLPFIEGMPHTKEHILREHHYSTTVRGVPGEHVAARVAVMFFPYLFTRTLFFETKGAPMHVTGAAGSIILALALYAIVRRRGRVTWFFAGLFVFCVLAGCEWRPLSQTLAKLPVFDIALTDRMITGAAFFLAILAALGAEELARRNGDRLAGVVAALTLIVITGGNLYLQRARWFDHGETFFHHYVIAAEIAGLAAAAALLFVKRPLIPALLAVLLAQRAVSDLDFYKTFTRRQSYPPIPMLEPLRAVKEPFRITGHGFAFPPATSTMYELEDIRGYSAMTFNRLVETFPLWCIEQPVYFNRIDDLTAPFLSFLNVRYALTWDREPPPKGWREVARQEGSLLIENMNVIERAFVPRSVHVSRDTYLQPAMRFATDFRERAWIEADADTHERVNGPGTVSIRNAKLGYVMQADMQAAGWIVISESAWPGWRAYVDGRRVNTHVANHAFMAVYVPAGKHEVRMKYWPESFVIGRAITLGTLAVLMALALAGRFLGVPRSSSGSSV